MDTARLGRWYPSPRYRVLPRSRAFLGWYSKTVELAQRHRAFRRLWSVYPRECEVRVLMEKWRFISDCLSGVDHLVLVQGRQGFDAPEVLQESVSGRRCLAGHVHNIILTADSAKRLAPSSDASSSPSSSSWRCCRLSTVSEVDKAQSYTNGAHARFLSQTFPFNIKRSSTSALQEVASTSFPSCCQLLRDPSLGAFSSR